MALWRRGHRLMLSALMKDLVLVHRTQSANHVERPDPRWPNSKGIFTHKLQSHFYPNAENMTSNSTMTL